MTSAGQPEAAVRLACAQVDRRVPSRTCASTHCLATVSDLARVVEDDPA